MVVHYRGIRPLSTGPDTGCSGLAGLSPHSRYMRHFLDTLLTSLGGVRLQRTKKGNIKFAQQCDDELKVLVAGAHGWFGFSIIRIYQGSILNHC